MSEQPGFEPDEEPLDLGEEWLTARDAVAQAVITYRQFDYWVRSGLVNVLEREADAGSGVPRYIHHNEVEVLGIIGRLVDIGMEPRAAAEVARTLRATGFCIRGGFRITRVPAP